MVLNSIIFVVSKRCCIIYGKGLIRNTLIFSANALCNLALHSVAEQVSCDCPLVDKMILSVVKMFLKYPAGIYTFRDKILELYSPPEPVLVCWTL